MTVFTRSTVEAAVDSREAWISAGHRAMIVMRDTTIQVWVSNRA